MVRCAVLAVCLVTFALGAGCDTKSGGRDNPDNLEYSKEAPAKRDGGPVGKK